MLVSGAEAVPAIGSVAQECQVTLSLTEDDRDRKLEKRLAVGNKQTSPLSWSYRACALTAICGYRPKGHLPAPPRYLSNPEP